MSTTLKAEWEDYRRKIIPAFARAVQIRETRRGFYAGAIAAFAVVAELEQTLGTAKALKRVRNEIKTFANLAKENKDTDI